MSIIQGTSKAAGGGYTIDQSIRFNDDDSAYLSRTPSSSGSATDWTLSTWLKLGNLGTDRVILSAGTGGNHDWIQFQSNGTLRIVRSGSSILVSNQVFRDPSGWGNLVVESDLDNAIASEKLKVYWNGSEITSWSTDNRSSYSSWVYFNQNVIHNIGRRSGNNDRYFDGYMAEIYFIDGQALGPDSFGEYNDDGVWIPKAYTGSYGTNGFHITGETASDLGEDFSGNNNDFTSSGLTTTDQMLDTPSDNYWTLTPLDSNSTLANGNLQNKGGNSTNTHAPAFPTTGKWYVEIDCNDINTGTAGAHFFGICDASVNYNQSFTDHAAISAGQQRGGQLKKNNSNTTTGTAVNDGDIIALAFDADNLTLDLYVNNSQSGSQITGLTDVQYKLWIQDGASPPDMQVNFGQTGGFTYTPPTGFKALSTANLDDPIIANPAVHFNTVLYEGNGGGQRVGQFQPITETYTVPNSVIFNDDDSAYLTKTFASAGNRKTWTFSTWVKFATIKSDNTLFSSWISSGASAYQLIYIDSAFRLRIEDQSSNRIITNQVFKDASAWYHVVARVDTTDATSSNRFQLWINGERITSFSTEVQPPLNFEGNINKGSQPHYLGRNGYSLAMLYSDLYQAETHFIDGTALDASDFGQLDASTNKWIPKAYSGSYGTNGFYLDMETAPGTGSGAGTDSSGNGNNWTESGLAAADQVTDSPTNNQSVLDANRIDAYTLSQGNLFTNAVGDAAAIGTIAFDPQDEEGFYFEAKVTTAATYPNVGIRTLADIPTGSGMSGNTTGRYAYTGSNGQFDAEGTGVSYGDVWAGTANKVIGVYIKAGELFFSVDGTIQNSGTPAITGLTGLMVPTVFYDAGSGTHASWEMRFNSSDWSTTPSGYKSISTDNLPLSNGDLSAFVWIKNRDAADNHMLFDAVRGATKDLHSNVYNAEVTNPNTLTRFLKNGFEVGNDVEVNTSGESYVAWQWLNDSLTTSSNTDGSITSTVLANTTSGFSVVGYVGNSTSGATVGHGLGAVPKMMILKDRDVIENWVIYHDVLGPTKFMYFTTDAAFTVSNRWNNTAPTSSVFTLGNETQVNATGRDYVVYCFAEVEGFSKFGSYTGNSSTDGPFVYTGFKPAFIMTKRTDSTGDWMMVDSERSPYNLVENALFANLTDFEDTTGDRVDILSNGFKLRTTAQPNVGTLVYMAFAESPFKTATAR